MLMAFATSYCNYVGTFDMQDPGRFRFFDLLANRLNTRRAVREIVTPELEALQKEVAELRVEVKTLVKQLEVQSGNTCCAKR